MSEEHGYQRSGKKCREKFENLYKYYKKTKEGKAGRQDGKHYRFHRQLEAIFGESSSSIRNLTPESNFSEGSFRFQGASGQAPSLSNQEINFQSTVKHSNSLSLTNTTDLDTSSSDFNNLSNEALMENDCTEKRRNRRSSRRGWQAKIKHFIDSQMMKLMDKQEAWLERLMKSLEQKEEERIIWEGEWRKQEAARLEREHEFRARERARTEARDVALVEALQRLSRQEIKAISPHVDLMVTEIENHNEEGSETPCRNARSIAEWLPESDEVTRLIKLRSQGSVCSEEKRKEKSGCYFVSTDHQTSSHNQASAYCEVHGIQEGTAKCKCTANGQGCSPSASNGTGNAVSESCFRFFMTDGDSLWGSY